MELPSKSLEQIAFNTRPRREENILVVMDKSIPEEQLDQPLQTNNKKFKIAVTFLTCYDGTFNITNKSNKSFFTKSISGDFVHITIQTRAYELESLNDEIKKIINNRGFYNEENYFFFQPNFSTLGSIIEISEQGPLSGFFPDHSVRDLLGFKSKVIHEENNLSDYIVDILSFDNIFLKINIAQGMIFRGRIGGINHNWAMTVDLVYKNVEKFAGGISW